MSNRVIQYGMRSLLSVSLAALSIFTVLPAEKASAAPLTVSLSPVRPDLSFDRPLDLQFSGSFAYVAEQDGTIRRFNPTDSGAATDVLDVSSLVTRNGSEQGLLGFALHPDFSRNGYLYVNYTRKSDGATVISRFTVDPSSGTASVSSERQILVVPQPFENHNAGSLVFGNDGFLYIPLGDGGSAGDPQGNAQNRASLLGKILRIDVDVTDGTYQIPARNPYRGNTKGFREEVLAYGLRNPFKITVDRPTGRIWAGDVGQDRVEEVDIIRRGANYGWNKIEGNLCYPSGAPCKLRGVQRPVTTYNHSLGESITGGYVYRGKAIRRLQGAYIYGDFVSGRIWSSKRRGRRYVNRQLLDTDQNISSFGLDSAGELYVVDYSGSIYRLVTP
jgi:glucose/arabinose dehydrogenase